MQRRLVAWMLVNTLPASAFAAAIPLREGEYARGQCNGAVPEIGQSFGVYTLTEGKQKGKMFLSPQAEGQEGACTIGKINVSDSNYSGVAQCEDGGSRLRYSTGNYHFSLNVTNSRAFISKGQKYIWCAPHR